MSDAGAVSPATLPPAAVDVTAYRRAVEELASPAPFQRLALVVFVVAVVLLVAGLATMVRMTGSDAVAAVAASGLAGVGVLLALLVVLPAQLAARRRRRLGAAVTTLRHAAAVRIRGRLASIGYTVPLETAREWLDPVQSDATVPLVHDSVIAARLWRPAATDDRVFLEPYLRQGETSSLLPVLPAV